MRISIFFIGVMITAMLGGAIPASVAAQIRASERATVSQTVDGTTFTVDYSRPRLRGRHKDMFGKQIEWNEVWTPGANKATTLRASRAFFINGHAVPAGYYSVWLQVKPKGDWTFALHADTMRQHFMHPKMETAKLTFDIAVQTAPLTEVLTWSFPEVSPEGVTLELAWDTIRVPLKLTVTPTQKRAIGPADAAPYVGDYDVEWLWDKQHPTHETMKVYYNASDSTLRADSHMGKEPWNLIMAPVSKSVFSPLFLMAGGVSDAGETMLFEFTQADGHAISFDVRDRTSDELQARARRKQ